MFTYLVAIPLGIYSAVRQYSIGDHTATVVGYIGLATPNFLFALILLYLGHKWFGMGVGGLFSPEFEDAAWTWARFGDMLMHLWVPVIVLGTAGTAFQLRTMRATLLDELNKMYVTAARAGGVPEFRMLMKYPVRMALNPIVATLGWELTNIISGVPVVAMVLSLNENGIPVDRCAEEPGYVSCRRLDSDPLHTGDHRDLYLGYTAHDSGSAHPSGGPKLKCQTNVTPLPMTKKVRRLDIATHWQLMWWRFRKHRMAMFGTAVLGIFLIISLFCRIHCPLWKPVRANTRYLQGPSSGDPSIRRQLEFSLAAVYLRAGQQNAIRSPSG